jgi:hypothetical protein
MESQKDPPQPFQPPDLDSLKSLKFDKYVGPTAESNWVLPGVLLVGAYPASNDDEAHAQLLRSILELGIGTFVCLQKEYQPHVSERMWRTGKAIRPYIQDAKQMLLANDGMRQTSGPCVLRMVEANKLDFVHFPIVDCACAEDANVLDLARNLVARLFRGEVLYLHCWGGHGRTGTLVCIMLHLMYKLNAQQAMLRCQKVHDMRNFPIDVGSPQTVAQREQVVRIIGSNPAADNADGRQIQEQVNFFVLPERSNAITSKDQSTATRVAESTTISSQKHTALPPTSKNTQRRSSGLLSMFSHNKKKEGNSEPAPKNASVCKVGALSASKAAASDTQSLQLVSSVSYGHAWHPLFFECNSY